MQKLLYTFIAISIFACTNEDKILGSCYISPNPDIVCTEEYQPVCACNNLVYGNACEAEKAGNLHYRSTNKDSGEECCY